jgi:hypothetical protein
MSGQKGFSVLAVFIKPEDLTKFSRVAHLPEGPGEKLSWKIVYLT